MIFTCVDSFSGAGGLALGLQNAGFNILLSFDIDAKCIETINQNAKYFLHFAKCEDVKNMLGGQLLRQTGLKKGELFLLAGGPPCQGFSAQRIGDDNDIRNELIIQYGKLVGEMRPYFFLMENVAGIQGKRGIILLSLLTEQMRTIGYTVHKELINAADYGVPQRRKRVILVGEREDIGKDYKFPTPFYIKKTVRETISFLPPPPENGTPHPDYPLHRRDRLSEKNIQRLLALRPGEGRDHLPEELLADCHRIDSDKIGHRNVYGRMNWDKPAPTITARFDSFTRGMFGHPEQARSISLCEGALLQTFPLDFKFSGNKIEIAKQIGNAVPPKLAEILGKSIIDYYSKKR